MTGKRKTSAMKRILAWNRETTAERIAREILASVAPAERYCRDEACAGRQQYVMAEAHAALARMVGEGRSATVEQGLACSEAEMAAMVRMDGETT